MIRFLAERNAELPPSARVIDTPWSYATAGAGCDAEGWCYSSGGARAAEWRPDGFTAARTRRRAW